MKHYDLGFVALYYQEEELNHIFTPEEKKEIVALKVTLHLNRAQCKLKLLQWSGAVYDCDEAIKLDKICIKGYQRRISARLGMIDDEMAKEVRCQYWDVDTAWALSELAYQDFQTVKSFMTDSDVVSSSSSVSGSGNGNGNGEEDAKLTTKSYMKNSGMISLQRKLIKSRKHLKAYRTAFKKVCNQKLRERFGQGTQSTKS